jgi:hypothetical protein
MELVGATLEEDEDDPNEQDAKDSRNGREPRYSGSGRRDFNDEEGIERRNDEYLA